MPWDLLVSSYAFLAGMVATVNPCGVAMLPAYFGYHLGMGSGKSASWWRRGGEGLSLGLTVTLGFLSLFLVLGLAVQQVARSLAAFFPWATLLVGIGLVGLGLFWLRRGSPHLPVLPISWGRGFPGYFLFGVAYATASLSCTLPVFIAVLSTSLAAPGRGAGTVVSYGLGMGLVVTSFAVAVALFRGALERGVSRLLPLRAQLSALFLLAAGAYLVARALRLVL